MSRTMRLQMSEKRAQKRLTLNSGKWQNTVWEITMIDEQRHVATLPTGMVAVGEGGAREKREHPVAKEQMLDMVKGR